MHLNDCGGTSNVFINSVYQGTAYKPQQEKNGCV